MVSDTSLPRDAEEKTSQQPNDGMRACEHCGGEPCDWTTLGSEVMRDTQRIFRDEKASEIRNNAIRKTAYKLYSYLKFGHLGKGRRIVNPRCLTSKIREKWPDENNSYMGHKEK